MRKGVALAKWEDLIGLKLGIAPGSAVWFRFATTITEANVLYNKLSDRQYPGGRHLVPAGDGAQRHRRLHRLGAA